MKLQTVGLDRIDLRILDHLQVNGRASNLELAEVAKLSPAQCLRRHRRLEELGLITGYAARLNARHVGLGVIAFIHVTMARGHVDELPKFQDLIADMRQILECYSVTGDFDYVIKVVASDLESLSQFLMHTLMRMPGVSAVRSSVCLNEIKSTTALPLE
ncbi:Lrp/AsnC family transcriptional regulator [Acidovorax cavernicola]|uniref:Lrp/AsnC family transcriptional regulator n=1 Tax=Acidovorax cavernicola TaxID=1675792 RepID=UPI0026BD63E7